MYKPALVVTHKLRDDPEVTSLVTKPDMGAV